MVLVLHKVTLVFSADVACHSAFLAGSRRGVTKGLLPGLTNELIRHKPDDDRRLSIGGPAAVTLQSGDAPNRRFEISKFRRPARPKNCPGMPGGYRHRGGH
jgi:hypothetical protein